MKLPIRQYARLLSTYLRPQWRWALLLALTVLVSIALRLVNPQIIRAYIDIALEQGPLSELYRAALAFAGIAVLTQGLSVLATYLGETVAWTATNALRLDLLKHVMDLDATFHKEYSSGRLIERIDGDVATLSNFFSRFVIDVIGNGILVVGILGFLFREDWRIGLPILAFAVGTLFLLIWIRKLAIPYWTKFRKLTAELYGFLGEHIAGTEDIRGNGGVQHVMRRFYEFSRRLFPVRLRSSLGGYGMWMANVALFSVGHAVAFGVGSTLWRSGLVTIGTVYLIFHYTELLRGPISEIRTQITDLQRAESGIRRIRELVDARSALDDSGDAEVPEGALGIRFDDVSFAYDLARPAAAEAAEDKSKGIQLLPVRALEGIDFELQPGHVLGLLGRTGSGKTTLARLMVRLYDTTDGCVCVGGHNVRELPLAHLRQRVRMVPQEVQLFRATIRDNVRLFDSSIEDEQIHGALERLGIRDWILGLPRGLDTMLAAEGGGLSAGQGQLLALARAFLAHPGVIILDEASSRLDPATEQLLEGAMDRLLEGRSAVIIAHRLATVQRADDILILEDGKALEYGSREALISDSESHLSRLLQVGMEEVLV